MKERVAAVVKELRSQREVVQQLEQLLEFASISAENEKIPANLENWSFSEQLSTFAQWKEGISALSVLVSYNALTLGLRDLGLGFVVDLAAGWEEAPKRLLTAFEASWFGGLIEMAFSERRELQQFDRVSHEFTREKFQQLDHLLLQHNRARLASKHWGEIPHLDQGGS